jgi:hypothetical protein
MPGKNNPIKLHVLIEFQQVLYKGVIRRVITPFRLPMIPCVDQIVLSRDMLSEICEVHVGSEHPMQPDHNPTLLAPSVFVDVEKAHFVLA